MGIISKIKTAFKLEKELRRNKAVQQLNERFSTHFAPVKMYDKYPKYLRLITTRVCNLRCNMCSSVKLMEVKKYKQQFMDMKIIRKIIDEIKAYPKLKFSPFALEPTINPNVIEIVKMSVLNGVQLEGFFTNSLALNEELSKRLLDAGLPEINFSIDAADEEGYKLTRNSDKYDIVVKNINKFLELKEKGGYDVFTIASYVVSKETKAKAEKFKKLWEGKVDKVLFQEFEFQGGGQKRDFTPLTSERRRVQCAYPWFRMAVNVEGKVLFCYDDWYETVLIGDLTKESVTDIWNGETYNKYRQIHINRDFDKISVCAECEDWRTPGKRF